MNEAALFSLSQRVLCETVTTSTGLDQPALTPHPCTFLWAVYSMYIILLCVLLVGRLKERF